MLNLRKTASKISRDVRKFWLKINKIIDFKQKAESDEIRQKVGKIRECMMLPWLI